MGKNGILKNKAGEQIFPATTADQVSWNDRMNLKQAISEKLGAPYAASTVSSMTDRTRIYVYTGDESGYTKGNWYYWNGSSWVSGGVYNSVAVETDKTLTVAGKAADGEVVGQEIGSLKESIKNVADISPNLYQFADYGLYDESGADTENTNNYYWHSKPIPVKIGDVLRTSKHVSWLTKFVTLYNDNNEIVKMSPGSLTTFYTDKSNANYDEITIKKFEYNGTQFVKEDFSGYIVISFSQGDSVKDHQKDIIVKNTEFSLNYGKAGEVILNDAIPFTKTQKEELLPTENEVFGVTEKFTKPFVCINFDAFSFDDNRFKIVNDEYGFPATVAISPDLSANERDYTNYIKLLEAGWDVGLYESTDWPKDTYGDDAFSDNPSAEVTSAWESYVSKTVEKAKLYGVYLPLTWLCRQMRTCVALETACKKHGIKYIRGNDVNNWTTSKYFKPEFKMVTQPSQLYPHTVDDVISDITTAVKNGYGCTVFSHGLYDDEDTAKKNYGCTEANLKKVLDKIKELHDAGKIEVLTFSSVYGKYFPSELNAIEKRRNSILAIWNANTKSTKELAGVRWCAFGDSLTDKNTLSGLSTGIKNYVDYVAESTGLISTNCGYGGTGYMKGDTHNFVNRVTDIPQNSEVITVFGSFNDYEYISDKIGALGDKTTDTLYGAMYKFYADLFKRCPDAVVGMILPTKWGYLSSGEAKTKCDIYIKALKDTAKEFDIPVLDLYDASNLRPQDSVFTAKYYKDDNSDGTADTVHLLDGAHKKFIAPKVEAFIKQIYHVY